MGLIHSQVTSSLIWSNSIASEPEEILFPQVSCFASVHTLTSISRTGWCPCRTAFKQLGFFPSWLRPVLYRVPYSRFPSVHSCYSLAAHPVTFIQNVFSHFSTKISRKRKHSIGNRQPWKGSVTKPPCILASFTGKRIILLARLLY